MPMVSTGGGARHHEDVAGLRAVATRAKELQEIVELAVDVPTDGDWAGNRLHGAFLEHDLLHVGTELLEFGLAEELALLHILHELRQHNCDAGAGAWRKRLGTQDVRVRIPRVRIPRTAVRLLTCSAHG